MCVINGLVQGLIQAQWFTSCIQSAKDLFSPVFVGSISLVISVQFKNYKHINVKQFHRGV
jgi:hypothetical protein